MAGFQPLNFNYGIDPSLLSQNRSSVGSLFQFGGIESPVVAASNAPATAPGNWFSNLFGAGADGSPGLFSRQGMFGGTDTATGITTGGWAPTALGIGQAFMGARQGREAMGLARDQFDEAKRQFDLNFQAQRKTLNTQMEDRQRARVASNPGAYQGVDDYMKKNRV